MKLLITSKGVKIDSPVDPRFGRAQYLIVFDTQTREFEAIDNTENLNALHGAGIRVAKTVIDESVDAVITGKVGPKAAETLSLANIPVYQTSSGTIESAIQSFETGELKEILSPATV
jgi:predicted Fe-Mo cluster-binding NifX family protein